MNGVGDSLTSAQLAALRKILEQGSRQASRALAQWLGRDSVVELHALQQRSLAEATEILGQADQPLFFGMVAMQGGLTGHMALAFDEASGRALVDLLVDADGAGDDWNELAKSAVLETTNIVSCAYLNALTDCLGERGAGELLPTAPEFRQEFAECLMQFALMDQALAADTVLVASTRFELDATPLMWTLLFLPDATSLGKLPELLGNDACKS